jgi:phage gpG-like protein
MIPTPLILIRDFDKLGLDIRSFRVPLERSVREVLSPSLQENFLVGGRPTWAELSGYTIEKKERYFPTSAYSPLVASGKLERVAGQLNLWTINGPAGEAYIGKLPDRVWYGVPQQEGFVGGNNATTPARPWALIQPDDIPRVEEIFEQWLDERLVANGFSPLA